MGLWNKLFGKTAPDPSINDIAHEASQSTKLHVACSHGSIREVEALLAAGAKVNPTNKWGATPLDLVYSNADCAGRATFVQIAELLRAKGGRSRTWKGPTC